MRQNKFCEATDMIEKALNLNHPDVVGIYYSAGLIFTMCAMQDKSFPLDKKAKLLAQSDEFFKKGETLEPDKGNAYRIQAITYYIRGDYANAWNRVKKALDNGAKPFSENFINNLKQKMPEPTSLN